MLPTNDGSLINVKKRIEDILTNNGIATNSYPIKKDDEILESRSSNPIDKEIKLDPSKTIMSKTDPKGVIEFANDYFMEISGYQEHELMGQPHSIIRHPDMPKVVFIELWKRLSNGENIHTFVKNLSKDGRYYWVVTNFETKFDKFGNVVSYYARTKVAPGNAIYQIEKIYKTLKSIEDNQSVEVAEKYLNGFLEERNMNYDEFILDVLGMDENKVKTYFLNNDEIPLTPKKRGVINRLFK